MVASDGTVIRVASDATTDYQQVILAASQLTSAEPGQLSLVGSVSSEKDLTVPGFKINRHSEAVMVEGIRLAGASRVLNGMSEIRLVSMGPSAGPPTGLHVDAYEVQVPPTTSNLSLLFAHGSQTFGDPGRRSLEVYNWALGTWRSLSEGTSSGTVSVPLDVNEVRGGTVRLRANEANATGYFQVVSLG